MRETDICNPPEQSRVRQGKAQLEERGCGMSCIVASTPSDAADEENACPHAPMPPCPHAPRRPCCHRSLHVSPWQVRFAAHSFWGRLLLKRTRPFGYSLAHDHQLCCHMHVRLGDDAALEPAGVSWCELVGAGVSWCDTPRAWRKAWPGIAKNDNNNDINETTNNPTKQHPNSQRTKVKPIHLSSETPHISRHSFPTNTQRTTHSVPKLELGKKN